MASKKVEGVIGGTKRKHKSISIQDKLDILTFRPTEPAG